MTNPRALRAVLARAAAGILSLGLATAVAGCAGTASADSKPSGAASAPRSATASPAPTAKSYGDAIGTGKTVKTADGSYETIALPADSAIYSYQPSQELLAAGYTAADALAGRKLVADYMATQFFDSTALEAKDEAGLTDWAQSTAGRWFSPELRDDVVKDPKNGQVVLGNGDGSHSMPSPLVHDGKPRASSIDIQFTSVIPYDRSGHKGIEYDLNYSATYRLPTEVAVSFAASLGNMTTEQFLASNRAKPILKSKGTTEVSYVATGTARFGAERQASGGWLISGLQTKTDYDFSDFVDNS